MLKYLTLIFLCSCAFHTISDDRNNEEMGNFISPEDSQCDSCYRSKECCIYNDRGQELIVGGKTINSNEGKECKMVMEGCPDDWKYYE